MTPYRRAILVLALGALAVSVAALLSSRPAGAKAVWADDEVWVTSQGTDRLFILHHRRELERVPLPPNTGPHLVNFSPSGRYAYVSGMGNGDLQILRTPDRQIVQTLDLGSVATHQAKPSPDGSFLLVAQVATSKLIRVAADERAQSWTVSGSVTLPKAPICTIFRDDGERAYVSLAGSGLAIVDVPTMTVLRIDATDGFVACGMAKSRNGKTITIASAGGGGHMYRLATATDELTDAGTLGAADWHSFTARPNGRIGFGTSPASDELVKVDLRGERAEQSGTIRLDGLAGVGNDQPDQVVVRGSTVYVSLRASGKLAIVNVNRGDVDYVDISPPAILNPANCFGCAVHGLALRP